MTRLAASAVCLIVSSLSGSAQTAGTKARDAKLITHAKQGPGSQLDRTLPSVSFEKWLQVEAEADAKFQWEVNDCGEQSGTATEEAHDFPMCVEADVAMKDGRSIVIMIAVGTSQKSAVGKPELYFPQLITPRETINLRQLSDFPAALLKTHLPANHLETVR